MSTYLILSIVVGLVALGVAVMLSNAISAANAGTARMKEIAGYIHEGAMAFLYREYKYLAIFIVVVAAIIATFLSVSTALCFIGGAVFSICAGYLGMNVATKANVRTAEAARHGMSEALKIAFSGGAVMGLGVVGLGIAGLAVAYFVFDRNIDIVTGFGLGASSIALFARVGGGIYTKAADVGADLVGKVEAGIPEDDPRNPATIADNVGDNVGDVAGMGADLFESYVGAIISALTLGAVAYPGGEGVEFVFMLAVAGILASIIGVMFARSSKSQNPQAALNSGTYIGGAIVIAAAAYLSNSLFGSLDAFWAIAAGLLVGMIIGKITEIYTSADFGSVKKIAQQSETGPATTIIAGLAVGMYSTFWPMLFICIGVIVSFFVMGGATNGGMGLFGISLAAVGMLSTTGLTVAVDAYGPIADNAGGNAEMSGLGPEVRKRTDALDALGNTTAATGKGFAIGSAALTALALLASYIEEIRIGLLHNGVTALDLPNGTTQLVEKASLLDFMEYYHVSLMNPTVLIGVFVGAMMSFLFCGLTMNAVGRAAQSMVNEVRRQFREIKGILTGEGTPDYARCVEISTRGAQREMLLPSLLAIAVPVVVGLVFGVAGVMGLLVGGLSSGFVLAVFMANAGGAWDNAKKMVEEGHFGGKGSDCHKATVVGDTVGDPFKDTSGPSLNILIKLMSMVSIVMAGLTVAFHLF